MSPAVGAWVPLMNTVAPFSKNEIILEGGPALGSERNGEEGRELSQTPPPPACTASPTNTAHVPIKDGVGVFQAQKRTLGTQASGHVGHWKKNPGGETGPKRTTQSCFPFLSPDAHTEDSLGRG